MILGVDFDNTIVRYDELFHRVAVERGLIPATLGVRKNEVRDFLRQRGQEQAWTELQGYVYGPRMPEAQPFPGVLEFFTRCLSRKLPVHIISHKTRAALAGPAYDLQRTARDWLAAQGFFDPARVGLASDQVHFGTTRQEKIRLIQQTGCTHFIDDLEETFLEEAFPPGVVKILFGVSEPPAGLPGIQVGKDWFQISEYVFTAAK